MNSDTRIDQVAVRFLSIPLEQPLLTAEFSRLTQIVMDAGRRPL